VSFKCPHCGAHSHQTWYGVYVLKIENDPRTPWRADAEVIERIENDRSKDVDEEGKKRFLHYARRLATGEVFLHRREGNSLFTDQELANVAVSVCYTCERPSLWIGDRVVYPRPRAGIEPNPDLPPDVLRDYDEARGIVDASPRGAAALLRLGIQKLCQFLGESGSNINDNIASLVRNGLDTRIQKALDIVRVIGNEAVHPGQMDLRDDRDIAMKLLDLSI
jgi:hypothetical protein